MQSEGRIDAPSTVTEGGTLVIRVALGVDRLTMFVPGVGKVDLPVVSRQVEYVLPPAVRGGATILITDGRVPNPSGASVRVVGGQSR
jgi:hypothetical protein